MGVEKPWDQEELNSGDTCVDPYRSGQHKVMDMLADACICQYHQGTLDTPGMEWGDPELTAGISNWLQLSLWLEIMLDHVKMQYILHTPPPHPVVAWELHQVRLH